MSCKAGSHDGKAFYWTPYVAVDIDYRPHHTPASLYNRYERCRTAIPGKPVVLRSPGNGLHVYFPLTIPVSTLGLTHSFKSEWPVLVPMALEVEGLHVRSGWAEVYPTKSHTLRLPLAWGTVQLDPETLAPFRAVPRAVEIAGQPGSSGLHYTDSGLLS